MPSMQLCQFNTLKKTDIRIGTVYEKRKAQ